MTEIISLEENYGNLNKVVKRINIFISCHLQTACVSQTVQQLVWFGFLFTDPYV